MPCINYEICRTRLPRGRLQEHLEKECSERKVKCQYCKEGVKDSEQAVRVKPGCRERFMSRLYGINTINIIVTLKGFLLFFFYSIIR